MPRRAKNRTYRRTPMEPRLSVPLVERLVGHRVVIWDRDGEFRYATLLWIDPNLDTFRIKYRNRDWKRTLAGIWRIHDSQLFTGSTRPVPSRSEKLSRRSVKDSRLTHSSKNNQPPGGLQMATKSESKRGRPGPLDHLNPTKRQQLAKKVAKARADGMPWDGEGGIREQYPDITSAGVGRNLLKELGRDDLIREVVRNGNGGSSKAKTKAKKPAAKKAAAKAKKPAAKKRVIRRGTGKKQNP